MGLRSIDVSVAAVLRACEQVTAAVLTFGFPQFPYQEADYHYVSRRPTEINISV